MAISTPLGKSGIGIVRMSGPRAIEIADEIFLPAQKISVKHFPSHTIHYGFIVEDREKSEAVDEVLLTLMRRPRTYTREDIVEINCHGGLLALRKVLELCIQKGARLANPGEFTLRAFLNGRIDLTQAEAVLNIVDAKTEEGLKIATRQLRGSLSEVLNQLREELMNILSELEALLDFPEEEIPQRRKEEIIAQLSRIEKKLKELLKYSKEIRLIQEGVRGVICGKPNVGKSSLMNALLGKERVIVTPIPGTTRDVVEEIIDLNGLPLRIADTAGIIETQDLIEKEGIRRAREEIAEADVVILVLDASQGIDKDDLFIFEQIKQKQHIVCLNKIDLKEAIQIDEIKKYGPGRIIKTSAIDGRGIARLKDELYNMFLNEKIDFGLAILTNLRHQSAIEKAIENIGSAIARLEEDFYLEIVSYELKSGLSELSRILGREVSEEILEQIFSRFCIGK